MSRKQFSHNGRKYSGYEFIFYNKINLKVGVEGKTQIFFGQPSSTLFNSLNYSYESIVFDQKGQKINDDRHHPKVIICDVKLRNIYPPLRLMVEDKQKSKSIIVLVDEDTVLEEVF